MLSHEHDIYVPPLPGSVTCETGRGTKNVMTEGGYNVEESSGLSKSIALFNSWHVITVKIQVRLGPSFVRELRGPTSP